MPPLKTPSNPWVALMGPLAKGFSAPPIERASLAFDRWTQFIILRGNEELELSRRLAGCRTPMDVRQAYVDFWKTTLEQYGEYCARLMQDAQPQQPPTQQPNVQERGRHKAAA